MGTSDTKIEQLLDEQTLEKGLTKEDKVPMYTKRTQRKTEQSWQISLKNKKAKYINYAKK